MALVRRVPELSAKVDTGDFELVEVRSSPDVSPQTEAISLSFAGLSADPETKWLRVLLDPEPQNEEWTQIKATAVTDVPLKELLADKIQIVSIPVSAPMTVYIWRTPFLVK